MMKEERRFGFLSSQTHHISQTPFYRHVSKKSIKRYPNTPRFLGDCGTVGGNEGFWGGWGSPNRRATHGKKPKLGYHLDDEMER